MSFLFYLFFGRHVILKEKGGFFMKISYHGHSVVLIESADGTRIIIDPFITGNSLTDLVAEDVSVDYILITHGHNDHVGDMIEIGKRCGATIVAVPEITHFAEKQGIKNTHGMNIGGAYEFPFGRVKMVFAQHSSGYELGDEMLYMGEPAGFVLTIDGKTIYHAGDTAYFSDLGLVKEEAIIDVAFLPIGDNFTMGPKDAVKASARIGAKRVVPIHYNTFPVIQQNGEAFVTELPESIGLLMAAGDELQL